MPKSFILKDGKTIDLKKGNYQVKFHLCDQSSEPIFAAQTLSLPTVPDR